MAFINRLKNIMFPPEVSKPEGNPNLGNGAVVMPKKWTGAEHQVDRQVRSDGSSPGKHRIKQDLLEQNGLASAGKKLSPQHDGDLKKNQKRT